MYKLMVVLSVVFSNLAHASQCQEMLDYYIKNNTGSSHIKIRKAVDIAAEYWELPIADTKIPVPKHDYHHKRVRYEDGQALINIESEDGLTVLISIQKNKYCGFLSEGGHLTKKCSSEYASGQVNEVDLYLRSFSIFPSDLSCDSKLSDRATLMFELLAMKGLITSQIDKGHGSLFHIDSEARGYITFERFGERMRWSSVFTKGDYTYVVNYHYGKELKENMENFGYLVESMFIEKKPVEAPDWVGSFVESIGLPD